MTLLSGRLLCNRHYFNPHQASSKLQLGIANSSVQLHPALLGQLCGSAAFAITIPVIKERTSTVRRECTKMFWLHFWRTLEHSGIGKTISPINWTFLGDGYIWWKAKTRLIDGLCFFNQRYYTTNTTLIHKCPRQSLLMRLRNLHRVNQHYNSILTKRTL